MSTITVEQDTLQRLGIALTEREVLMLGITRGISHYGWADPDQETAWQNVMKWGEKYGISWDALDEKSERVDWGLAYTYMNLNLKLVATLYQEELRHNIYDPQDLYNLIIKADLLGWRDE